MNHPSPATDDRTLCALEQYSFSDEAAQIVRAGNPRLNIRHTQSIDDVWHAITNDEALGMIPFENSSGGVVWPHLEHLMNEGEPLRITAAVRLQIKMCVGGSDKTVMTNVRTIHSHPKALEQSSKFLSGFPDAQKVTHSSTVEGVKAAMDSPADAIALASRAAIEAHGLCVLAEDVANLPGERNVTKFFVVHKNGHDELPAVDRTYHAAIVTPHDEVGVLAAITGQLASSKINLTSVHSRAIGEDEYAFYLEMDRRGTEEELRAFANWIKVSSSIRSVKWLGSWNTSLRNSFTAAEQARD